MLWEKIDICNQYDQMNNGPHERPFVPISAPSLAYHIAFWHPDVVEKNGKRAPLRQASGSRADAPREEEETEKTNAQLVGEYFEWVCAHFSEKNATFTASSNSGPGFVKERTRTWTASFRAQEAEEVTLIAECHTEYWRLSVFLAFNEKEAVVCAKAREVFKQVMGMAPEGGLSVDLSGVRSALVDEFEVFVRDRVLPPVTDRADFLKLTKRCFCNLIGSIFWKPDTPGRWPDYDLNSDKVWDEPFLPKPRVLVRQMWPMIERLQGQPSATPGDRDYEMAASLLLGGRAVYASSLGHPITSESNVTGKVPVIYSLIVCFDDAWQLGRLVDVVHSMETLRLAALRDIDKISAAAKELFSIRASLRKGVSLKKVQARMERLLRLDVSWRIERSQRYWRQFRHRIDRLRIVRIEGFQAYDSFVYRRIGDTITFIESTGRQLAFIRKEVDLRYQQKQTNSLEATGRRIFVLQKYGELLLLIPFSYYCYMLSEKVLKKSTLDPTYLSVHVLGLFLVALALLVTVLVLWWARRAQETEMKRLEALDDDE